jgi:hypothetical protein
MTQKMRDYLKNKNINLAIFEGLINEEIKIAIEEYKKEKELETQKKETQKKETPKTISDAMLNNDGPNE